MDANKISILVLAVTPGVSPGFGNGNVTVALPLVGGPVVWTANYKEERKSDKPCMNSCTKTINYEQLKIISVFFWTYSDRDGFVSELIVRSAIVSPDDEKIDYNF